MYHGLCIMGLFYRTVFLGWVQFSSLFCCTFPIFLFWPLTKYDPLYYRHIIVPECQPQKQSWAVTMRPSMPGALTLFYPGVSSQSPCVDDADQGWQSSPTLPWHAGQSMKAGRQAVSSCPAGSAEEWGHCSPGLRLRLVYGREHLGHRATHILSSPLLSCLCSRTSSNCTLSYEKVVRLQ